MLFKPDQLFLILDWETYSEMDITKHGSYEYSMHHSTEILCGSWRLGTAETLRKKKVQSWAPRRPWSKHREDSGIQRAYQLYNHIINPNIIIVAHNAMFEQAIIRNVLARHLGKLIKEPIIIPHNRFFCTAVQSAVYALPRKLENVTEALNLKHQKDKEGHALMLKISKPRKPTKDNPNTRHDDPEKFDRLVQYCEHDIYAETELFLTLGMHSQAERNLWVFDQEINFRGINVDRPLVEKILVMITEEKRILTKQLRQLTDDQIQTGGQRDEILRWLRDNDVFLPNLKAKTVSDAIAKGLAEGVVKQVLELRQLLTKTSLKKYTSFLDYSISDSIVRLGLIFNGASPGRWTGSGVQLHNCPRGTLKYTNDDGQEIDLAPIAADMIKNGADLELIRLMFGNPMEVFVSCIRGMIVAPEGEELFIADFAAIETRILFWLADHHEGCKAFFEGRKMYEEMAMAIYMLDEIMKVSKGQRFVGKETVLGSGYGMGWKKFQSTCLEKGVVVSTEVAKLAINSYREKHKPVPQLWKKLEKAAISAVENPTKTFKINHTEWFMEGRFLACRLPSGRCLYYCDPEVKFERNDWGGKSAKLSFMGVHPKTKKWVRESTWGGKLTENVVQAISRDLMALAMVRQKKAGYTVILTVHDEIIARRKIGEGNIEEFNRLMRSLPEWAKGAPVNVEGFISQRYKK